MLEERLKNEMLSFSENSIEFHETFVEWSTAKRNDFWITLVHWFSKGKRV